MHFQANLEGSLCGKTKTGSICALSGKSGGEFVRKDKNWMHCAGVGAGGIKKTKCHGIGGIQGFWRRNGEESRIQDRARVRSNYLRAVIYPAPFPSPFEIIPNSSPLRRATNIRFSFNKLKANTQQNSVFCPLPLSPVSHSGTPTS